LHAVIQLAFLFLGRCRCYLFFFFRIVQVIFGGQLVTVAGGGCTFKGTNAMVVEGIGPCTAPVPEGYMVA
jgi:hypothetical protein